MIIINAEIHTMDENNTVIKNGYIEYYDGKIKDIGDMKELTHISSEIFDAENLPLYPGFVDAHTHLGMFGDSLTFEGDDGNEDTDPVMPQLRAIDSINPMDGYFYEALSSGITTVITGPGSADPVAGQAAAINLEKIRNQLIMIRSRRPLQEWQRLRLFGKYSQKEENIIKINVIMKGIKKILTSLNMI